MADIVRVALVQRILLQTTHSIFSNTKYNSIQHSIQSRKRAIINSLHMHIFAHTLNLFLKVMIAFQYTSSLCAQWVRRMARQALCLLRTGCIRISDKTCILLIHFGITLAHLLRKNSPLSHTQTYFTHFDIQLPCHIRTVKQEAKCQIN